MGNMSGVIIRRNPESGVISERFPGCFAHMILISGPRRRIRLMFRQATDRARRGRRARARGSNRRIDVDGT